MEGQKRSKMGVRPLYKPPYSALRYFCWRQKLSNYIIEVILFSGPSFSPFSGSFCGDGYICSVWPPCKPSGSPRSPVLMLSYPWIRWPGQGKSKKRRKDRANTQLSSHSLPIKSFQYFAFKRSLTFTLEFDCARSSKTEKLEWCMAFTENDRSFSVSHFSLPFQKICLLLCFL